MIERVETTYQDLQKANEQMPTRQLKGGKDYVDVNQRLKVFRMLHPEGGIRTEMIHFDGEICVMRAEIYTSDGRILGSGTAMERKSQPKAGKGNDVNVDSFVENCETSAIGRALATCGIGLNTMIKHKGKKEEFSTTEKDAKNDVPAAVREAELRAQFFGYIKRHELSEEKVKKICERYQIGSIEDMSASYIEHYIKKLEEQGGDINS